MAIATATVLAIGALAAAAGGTYVAYEGQRQAARTAQSVADYNAAAEKAQGDAQAAAASAQIRRDRIAARRATAEQRARYAAGGVLSSTGSPLEVLGIDAGKMELASLEKARAASIARTASYANASATQAEGASAAGAYRKQSVGTLLSGASKIAGQGANYYDSGALSV